MLRVNVYCCQSIWCSVLVRYLRRMIRTLEMSTGNTGRNMASAPFEEQFRCCICIDIYTDPISIPCGHNFCLDCIEGYWDTKDKAECPLCKTTFRGRPDLRINHNFADIIEFFKRSLSTLKQEEDVNVEEQQLPEGDDVPCDICHGNKLTAVKSCLICQASYCETHLTSHLRDPALQRHRLTDPATFTTSHLCRTHNKPLEMFCKKDQTPVCEECAKREHKPHKIVPIAKESKRIKAHLKQTKSDIQQLTETRLTKIEEIKHSMDLSKKITEEEIQSSDEVCTMLITAIEKHRTTVVTELKQKQEEAETRAKELLRELEQEINDLQTRNSELQHLELTQNPLHLLQSFSYLSRLPSTRDWSEVPVHSDNCMGTVRRAMSKLVDIIQEIANTLSAAEADKMNEYAVDVTLDPVTASGWLALSPDGKKVSIACQTKKIPLPDSPQRFDSCVCVLGKQNFASGRRYWVVQVGDKTDWDLGVARETINRKGAIKVRPSSGYWAICRRKGGNLSVCTSPSITIHLKQAPQKVGIFLDYEDGIVSFFDADAKTHIYTYKGCTFTESLYPYFNPCVQDNGKNSAPLVICAV